MRLSQPECYTRPIVAAIVQWQNAALWQRMSWVRTPLAAPITPPCNLHPQSVQALAVRLEGTLIAARDTRQDG